MDSSVNIFKVLHIPHNILLRTGDTDGLWDRLGSAIQAQDCRHNKFLSPDVWRLYSLFAGPGILLKFLFFSEYGIFCFSRWCARSCTHALAQPMNCKLTLPVVAPGLSKILIVAVQHKMAGKNTGSCRAKLYRMCRYFAWFQHHLQPAQKEIIEQLSTIISVLVNALFRTHDLLSLLLEI